MEVGCRLSFVNLMKRKIDALDVSKVAIAALESEARKSLKSLRTDGGGEYVSAAWGQYARQKGITHELTAPYSPQQNGMAERLNRTLLEKMRCLLIWSQLPKSYWDVALLHANWLRNKLPTSAMKGEELIEAWNGRKHNLKKKTYIWMLGAISQSWCRQRPEECKICLKDFVWHFFGHACGKIRLPYF